MDNSFPTLFASVDVVEQVLSDFQEAWKRGTPPTLTQFFERIQDESPQVRESVQLLLVLHDQNLRWEMWRRQRESLAATGNSMNSPTESSGRAPLLEDYVRFCSLDGGLQSLPPEMVAHEFRLRSECGDPPTLEEYLHRFPDMTPTLSVLLTSSHTAMQSQITVTKDDAPTALDPSVAPLATPSHPLETTLPMSAAELPKRRKVADRTNASFGQYELLNEIARGAMGIVYRARHVTIDKIVALKMILAGQFASERQVEQFLLEAQNAGRLEHDNIVRIYDAGQINDQYYIAMAYIEGQSLADSVREKSLNAQRAAEIVEAVARALHFAHTQPQPVYHRDIKPANILLDHAGRAYVTDFGIAKRVEREDSTDNSEDDIAGTPSYMPPEQTYGRDIGPWSDVYSTGAMLYHLLTGKPPFLGESPLETIRQVRQTEPLPPSELNPKVDPDLEAVCLKCLEKDRTKRYLSAEQLADDLRRFLNHEPTQARPISQFGRFAKWCYRNPAVAGLTLTTALLLVAVAIGTTVALFREKESKIREVLARQKAERAETEAIQSEKNAIDARDVARRETDAKAEALKGEKAAKEDEKKAKEEALIAQRMEEKAKDDALMAQKKEERQRMKAEKAELEAVTARTQAEANLQRAIQTVDVILTQSADSGLKDVPGMEDFRKRVAQSALEQLKPIIDAHPDSKEAFEAWARLLVVQAKLLTLTGENEKAVGVLRDAVKEYLKLTTGSNGGKQHLMLDLVAAYRQLGECLGDQAKVDSSTSERPLDPESRRLLEEAVEEYNKALAVQVGRPAGVETECRWKSELARTHQSQCIALIYLKRSAEGIGPLEQAILSLSDSLGKLPPIAVRRDAERRLASCYSTLAMAEALENSRPSLDVLEKRLKRLEEAKAIHERLLRDDSKATEPRFDLALTLYSRAQVLTSLAGVDKDKSRFVLALDEALDEVEESREAFSTLASESPKTPKYEARRIDALFLMAVILIEQTQYAKAAAVLKDADMRIRTFNDVFAESRQPNLRLRICVSALELYITHLSNADISDRKAITSWLKVSFGSLRTTSDSSTNKNLILEAAMLESVAERFSGAVLAEQSNQLSNWLSELQSAESELKGYEKTNPDPNALYGHMRLSICREALQKANEYSKKGDPKTLPATIKWSSSVFEELRSSKDPEVAAKAVEFLKLFSAKSKTKS